MSYYSFAFRLKEELIRELVKNSRTGKRLNEAYLTKIQTLEQVSETITVYHGTSPLIHDSEIVLWI